MKKKINFKFIFIILLSIVLFFSLRSFKDIRLEENKKTISDNIEKSLDSIVELSNIKYNYTNIAEYDNSLEIKGITLPFTSKNFLVKYSGYLKAGSKLDDIKIEVVNPEEVIISLKEPEVLENTIIEEEVYFYNEKDSAFNRLKFDDLYSILKDEKLKIEENLIEEGFLEESKQSLERTLRDWLSSFGINKVKFLYKGI